MKAEILEIETHCFVHHLTQHRQATNTRVIAKVNGRIASPHGFLFRHIELILHVGKKDFDIPNVFCSGKYTLPNLERTTILFQ